MCCHTRRQGASRLFCTGAAWREHKNLHPTQGGRCDVPGLLRGRARRAADKFLVLLHYPRPTALCVCNRKWGPAGRRLAPPLAVRNFLSDLEGRSSGQSGPMSRTMLFLDSLSAFLFWDAAQVPALLWPSPQLAVKEGILIAPA